MHFIRSTIRVREVGRAALAIVLSLAVPLDVAQAETAPLELAVKATYLYKFAPFVEWPPIAFATPSSSFIVCVVGDDPFGDVLDRAVSGQRVGDRPIVLRRLARAAPGCHILYAAGSAAQPVHEIIDSVRGTPVLTVTDRAPDGAKGIVNLVVQENKVRFEIDDRAATASALVVSSKLLSLAVRVRPRS
ncbi:MAG: putative transrane protein [Rhodospirillales bacterium]|nr:putative transrane protein [Rhodospirillales bacterium]